jgi:(R)-2-hydroxyacyl-CoA dehydratese activating ATPase
VPTTEGEPTTMICAGIDVGSRTLKIVLFDTDRKAAVASGVVDQGIDQDRLAGELFERLLASIGLAHNELGPIVATGYGRKRIGMADAAITEITCQAWGVRHTMPEVRTIIDIGGQDSKLVRLGADGTVADFVMNDRCAAGTGRFLEMLAVQLGVPFAALGTLAERSRSPAAISSMCVVFAETEIVGLLASGVLPEDILAGVQSAIAVRIAAMAAGKYPMPIALTGGVALVPGMRAALESVFNREVAVAADPQRTGALGAALLAAQRVPR